MRGWLEEGWTRKGIKIKRRLKKENKFIFIFISLKCQWWKEILLEETKVCEVGYLKGLLGNVDSRLVGRKWLENIE